MFLEALYYGNEKRDSFNPNIFKGVAHRGLHDDKRFENSLSAFKNAIDHDFVLN